MKNFLRALRHTLPYRHRLGLSIFCALCAAVLWGVNFTSIYPFLKLLHTGQTPHEWIDEQIDTSQKEIAVLEKKLERINARMRELDARPVPMKGEEKVRRDLSRERFKIEAKLGPLSRSLYYYHWLRKYIYKFLPRNTFQVLTWVTVLVLVGVMVKCFFEFVQETLVGSVVNLALYDLRNRFYRNVIHLDVSQFDEHGTSELMARFTNDMESLGTGLKVLFGRVVAEPLRALSCVVLAFCINWQLTLMFLVLVPIAAFVLAKVGRILRQATRRQLERMSSIYKILQESFQGIRVVKAFTMEPYERRRFHAATKDYYHKAMRVVFIDALADPILEVLGLTAVAAALLVGSYLVLGKHTHLLGIRMTVRPMEPEALLQLYILLAAIADPIRKLSSVFTRLQSGCAAADRIFHFLDRRPTVLANTDGPRLVRPVLSLPGKQEKPGGGKPSRGSSVQEDKAGKAATPLIEFRDVCFSYRPGEPTLSNIRFDVRAGETIAVVGHNGSGKTTLLGLVPRLYDPDHGTVLMQGQDIRAVNLRSLRQLVGVVTQKITLFEDTIYNNIAYGTRGARPEQVEEAARRAFAHDFIMAKEGGYQFPLGEGGAGLSGGEKQRVTLARAILRNPSILILDEFTSSFDADTEVLIHRALRDFIQGRTTFVITHRLNTLEIADRIVVLEQGRIASVGTHDELIRTCPVYQRLQEAHGQRLCA